jgi:hypothetical protein
LIIARATVLLAFILAALPYPVYCQTSPAILPIAPGMYVATPDGLVKILGQTISFERSGSLLASELTGGLVSRKGNVQLLGQHAQTQTGPTPVFYFVPAKQEADAGGSGGDLVLVRSEPNTGSMTAPRRQFEMSAEGYGRASKGISITHQIQLLRAEESPGIYKLTPATALVGGEYVLYLARGEGLPGYVYDFSVLGSGNYPNIVLSEKSSSLAAEILKKSKNCPALSIIVQNGKSESDYTLEAAKIAGKPHPFQFALFNPHGDKVFQSMGDSLDSNIESLCHEITVGKIPGAVPAQISASSDIRWQDKVTAPANVSEISLPNPGALTTISVSSNPDGADIYVDGGFIGNAPAMLKLTPGKHTIKLTLAGYEDWSRDITALTGSEAHLIANFQKH